MSARIPVVALAYSCLLVGTTAWAQAPAPADLGRRLAELETQLGTLLKEVQTLRKEAQGPAGAVPTQPGLETKIFALKRAEAVELTRILQELFQGRDGRAVVVTADPRTNSIIVRGRLDLMQAIEAVIIRLDEMREPFKKSARPGELGAQAALAEANVTAGRERVAWSERMAQLGFLTQNLVQAERLRLRAAQAELERVRANLP